MVQCATGGCRVGGRLCADPTAVGTVYCGACWQRWIDGALAKRRADTAAVAAAEAAVAGEQERLVPPASTGADGQAVEPADDEPTELRGVFDNDTLYLVHDATRRVFASERDDNDRLVQVGVVAETGRLLVRAQEATAVTHPWTADDADHCETPAAAYADIAELLAWLATRLGMTRAQLRVYDPYYCAGGTARHLAALGFTNVYNRCEDFYARLAAGDLPPHDVLVTNPPYSCLPRDHIAALMQHLGSSSVPWLVVQPTHVYTKPYYADAVLGTVPSTSMKTAGREATLPCPRPFYLTPPAPRSYVYKAPPGFRGSGVAARTAPHVTFWYCWLGTAEQGAALRFLGSQANASLAGRVHVAATEVHLPDAFKDSNDRTRRKRKAAKTSTPSKNAATSKLLAKQPAAVAMPKKAKVVTPTKGTSQPTDKRSTPVAVVKDAKTGDSTVASSITVSATPTAQTDAAALKLRRKARKKEKKAAAAAAATSTAATVNGETRTGGSNMRLTKRELRKKTRRNMRKKHKGTHRTRGGEEDAGGGGGGGAAVNGHET